MKSAAPAIIEISGLNKWFGDVQVLKEVDLTVTRGERIVICGPSGSGKSTLLRCINGLEDYQAGRISIAGVVLGQDRRASIAARRDAGMVFQQFNLFPHLSVLDNLCLAPMRVRGLSRKAAEEAARRYLDRVHIPEQADKFPAQLSGGQQQRVAIARALCMNPKILLLDEPTSALDPEMIQEVLDVIVALAEDGMTMLCVTHEMGFARSVADRMVFMDAGEIVETAAPDIFFTSPEAARTQAFLGRILSR